MIFLLPAFLLGLIGSLHCVGMCGPIALAVPVREKTGMNYFSRSLIYSGGRASTYALMGGISGFAGSAIQWAGGQQWLSIICGSLILFFLIAGLTGKRMRIKFIHNKLNFLRGKMGLLFGKKNNGSVFLIGVLNGLLPCGLVYAGLAGAASTGNLLYGMFFMFTFGIGTSPALMALMLAGMKISVQWKEKINRMVPVFVAVMAIMLVLRGMQLGIPLLSPQPEHGKIVCPHCLQAGN
ncbi:MAG TPA: sulfite exporter TauE/SafE family protein [Bacteroidia bacterium]|jgi:sulfite exporter TauE/SafE|nr:sulfite exporter TauE/SafE family protein [Bacteroidia bacterium]